MQDAEDLQPRDWALLEAVREQPLGLSALARAARLPRNLVGITAHGLVEAGFLVVERPAAGGRRYRLTARGREALARR